MNLLHVVTGIDPAAGGVSQVVRSLLPALAAAGTQNEVVTLDAEDALYLKNAALPVTALGMGKGPWAWNPRLAGWLDAQVEKYDIVIVHGLWQYPTWAVRRALRRRRKAGKSGPACFVMPHGMLDPWFQEDASRRWKAMRNWLVWKGLEHRVISQADGLLFTCEEEKRLARTTFHPYSPKRELVVGLGTDPPPPETVAMQAAFRSACPGLPAGKTWLLFLGRIHPKKGVELLLEAYVRWVGGKGVAAADCPDLVIAGPGWDTAYGQQMQVLAAAGQARLDAMAATAGIDPSQTPRIRQVGTLTGDAKWGAFYGAEAFLLPSRQENFGIAVVEALACGTPVLVSNRVNIWREIVEDGAGFSQPDTVEGTLEMLHQWSACPQRKADWATATIRCARERFSIESTAARLLESIVPVAKVIAEV